MSFQQFAEVRGDDAPGELHRHAYRQAATHLFAVVGHGGIGFVERQASAVIETLAGFGEAVASGAAHDQPYAEPVFQQRDRLGQRRLADAQLARGGRERAAIDHRHEMAHRLKPVHNSFPSGMDVSSHTYLLQESGMA